MSFRLSHGGQGLGMRKRKRKPSRHILSWLAVVLARPGRVALQSLGWYDDPDRGRKVPASRWTSPIYYAAGSGTPSEKATGKFASAGDLGGP